MGHGLLLSLSWLSLCLTVLCRSRRTGRLRVVVAAPSWAPSDMGTCSESTINGLFAVPEAPPRRCSMLLNGIGCVSGRQPFRTALSSSLGDSSEPRDEAVAPV